MGRVGSGLGKDRTTKFLNRNMLFISRKKKVGDIIIELFACNCLYSWSIVMQKQLSRAIKMLRVNCPGLAWPGLQHFIIRTESSQLGTNRDSLALLKVL